MSRHAPGATATQAPVPAGPTQAPVPASRGSWMHAVSAAGGLSLEVVF